MKRIVLALALLLGLAGGASAQFTSTTNMGMKKPNAGLTTGWDVYLNGNFDQLDTYLGGMNTLTQNSTTPSVAGAVNWKTNNTSPTAVTNFTGGFSGQVIRVFCQDTNMTMVSGTNLSLQTPFACTTTNSITLVLNGTVWTEVARTYVATLFISFSPACNNATAGPGAFNVPTASAATFSCSGTTSTLGNADYVDGSTTGLTTQGILLPSNWTGAIDVKISWWANAASTNAARWAVAVGCVASGAAVNTGPSFNTASATNAAYTGTANQLQVTTLTGLTTTGCTGGTSQVFFQVQRIGGDAGDTLTATAELIEAQVILRVAR